MELFIPGFFAILIVGLVIYFILPRFGPPILAILSLILLFWGAQNHYSMFSSEYRLSTWQDAFKEYGMWFVIGFLFLSLLGYTTYLFSSSNSSPANSAGSAITGVLNATKENKSILSPVANVASSILNGTNKNKGTLANLGNIIATPFSSNKKNSLFS